MTSDISDQYWRRDGSCTNEATHYLPWIEDSYDDRELIEARRICLACPVKNDCLADALGDDSAAGIRAGTTDQQRRAMRRDSNGIGRPRARCGTTAGNRAHYTAGEKPCQDCRDASTAYTRQRRGNQPRVETLQPCGTFAAAKRHRLKGEPRCEACIKAEREYYGVVRARARQRRAA